MKIKKTEKESLFPMGAIVRVYALTSDSVGVLDWLADLLTSKFSERSRMPRNFYRFPVDMFVSFSIDGKPFSDVRKISKIFNTYGDKILVRKRGAPISIFCQLSEWSMRGLFLIGGEVLSGFPLSDRLTRFQGIWPSICQNRPTPQGMLSSGDTVAQEEFPKRLIASIDS